MQTRNLPANPSIEQYKKIAKALLRAWKQNTSIEIPWEGSVINVTREHLRQKHPRLRGLSELESESAEICLADVQFLIAREYGFESWSKFRDFIESKTVPDSTDRHRSFNVGTPLADSAVKVIQTGDVEGLERLLSENQSLAAAKITNSGQNREARTLLHIATDWPGHFPRVAETIARLAEAGADVDARFIGGPHRETALHWAASSNDVAALNALLDAGANIEADGAVIAGGTPMSDAVAFAQWNAARRLAELGATMNLDHEAALGLLERIESRFRDTVPPKEVEIDRAFWFACHGGQRDAANYLLGLGADPNWLPPWEKKTPREAAIRNGFGELAAWLESIGAK